jgi:hypothetical protein
VMVEWRSAVGSPCVRFAYLHLIRCPLGEARRRSVAAVAAPAAPAAQTRD